MNRFRGEIVILKCRPRTHVRWRPYDVGEIERIRNIVFIFFKKVSGHIQTPIEPDNFFILQKPADVGIDRAVFKPQLISKLANRLLAKVGQGFKLF